jgi:anti-sigma regulatory factor (Ser/Thr protein kinase)
VVALTPDVRHAEVPTGSAWRSGWPTQPRPMNAGMLALVALPTSPFWARRYTHKFLDSCRGITEDTVQTAELVVSELVTNAIRYSGDPTRTLRYSERASASLISLSLRHFSDRLLVEVFDTDSNPPVLAETDAFVEGSRGLVIVDALAKEWSFFYLPDGGKVVYCVLEIS